MALKVLFCDDDALQSRQRPTFDALKAMLAKEGIELDACDGRSGGVIPYPITAADVGRRIVELIKAGGHEGLIMDMRWWSDDLSRNNTFGLDLIDWIVDQGLPAPLTLDKIVVLTRHDEDLPEVRRRLERVYIPASNAFSKWHPTITAMFKSGA